MTSARKFSEGMLKNFNTPEQWLHQIHPKANHALWFAGHMGVTDNFFLSIVAPEKARDEPGFPEKFGMGSQPTKNAADYPPVEQVLAYMRDRRQALLAALSQMTEDDLAKPTPKGTPDFLGNIAAVFETAIWHEGLHSGQVSMVHRALGHPPLMGGSG
jgi:uncharacterized damage-inducible protein DinB